MHGARYHGECIVVFPQDLLRELQKGADVNAINDQHDSPLHSIVKRHFPNKEDKQKLLLALLMRSEVNINQKGAHGITALHLAVEVSDIISCVCVYVCVCVCVCV